MPDLSALRAGLAATDRDDRRPRLEFADLLDSEPGLTDPRGDVLRAACAIHERLETLIEPRPNQLGPLMNVLLPDAISAFWTESPGWATAARRLEVLATKLEDTEAFRQRYYDLVRGRIPLDPEDLEATLRLQYDFHVSLLSWLNLLEGEPGEQFITAIDGKRYPLPPFGDLHTKLQRPALREKISQGFDTLLLVPFGLSLDRLLEVWQWGLQRQYIALQRVGQFNQQQPLWLLQEYRTQPLVYDPCRFTDRHRGRTKEQLLREDQRGWDVLLVEGSIPDLPRAGQGEAVGGRPQIECGWSPTAYLRELAGNEVGLTPEAYIIAFFDALERRGQVLDVQTGSYLLGAYLPASRFVPDAYWSPGGGQARLDGIFPDGHNENFGARAAVRV